jgi:hypothetical protein
MHILVYSAYSFAACRQLGRSQKLLPGALVNGQDVLKFEYFVASVVAS